ncbi:GDSL-type esterase/lipase family protein [Streptomyces boninensis]|uniref:GDSL-type esterase/lipase family protein n=1 Tax=Streptomyces boninensis TaxID=2039455 RepID=UPI003B219D86
MRRTRRPTGSRATTTAVAAIAAAALTLSACTDGSSDDGGSRANSGPGQENQAKAQPKPKPKPKPKPAWKPRPASVAALGDSITRGFDACRPLADCPQVSWATGTDAQVDSLAARLGAKQRWNFARTGAQVDDLPVQANEAIAKKPELISILIGANDACRPTTATMTAVGTFRTTVADSLRTIRKELPKTQVYVASVPDLEQLWQIGKSNPVTKQIWKLGICQSMLKSPDATTTAADGRRGRVVDRVREFNRVLKEECGKVSLCRFDGNATFQYDFSTSDLSKWDYFHPSKTGQASLAEIAYRKVTGG